MKFILTICTKYTLFKSNKYAIDAYYCKCSTKKQKPAQYFYKTKHVHKLVKIPFRFS